MLCTITIEGQEVKVKPGSNLLWAALDNGFYIPNLCVTRGGPRPYASCRLCTIEIDGRPGPTTSCTEKTLDGMAVRVHTPRTARLRRTAFDLLLSNHRIDCAHCVRKRDCELHRIARAEHFTMRSRRFGKIGLELPLDASHALIDFDRSKCVLCGRCVWACQEQGSSVLDFAYRGIKTIVSTFADRPLSESGCSSCLACTEVCPVGALYPKSLLPGTAPDERHKPAGP